MPSSFGFPPVECCRTLLRLFEEKVGRLRETLDDEFVLGEAAEALARLIESVTIYPARMARRRGGGESI
jgi:hypothetical protein